MDSGVEASGVWGMRFPWDVHDVDSIAELPQVATGLLAEHPVLLVPPWGRRSGPRRPGDFDEHEDALLGCSPHGPSTLLAAVIPSSMLTARRAKRVRELLFSTWQPVLVLSGTTLIPGIHSSIGITTLFLLPRRDRSEPVRFFRIPRGRDDGAVDADLCQLMRQGGGTTRFGYAHRDPIEPGDILSFERYEPELRAQKEELSNFGQMVPMHELFELPGPAVHLARDAEALSNEPNGDAVRVLSGRDIRRDGTIAPADETSRWAPVALDRQLCRDDILMPAIFRGSDAGGFTVASVTEADLPVAASHNVMVLRPRSSLTESGRLLALLYLRSPLARRVVVSVGLQLHLVPSVLRELRVPQPDQPLTTALSDLVAAARQFEAWRVEAESLLQSAFEYDTAQAARSQLVRSGSTLRLRADAATLLDDHAYTIRTRYPYPIAYRWRLVEANMSSGNERDAFNAVLEATEVLLCYTAHLALIFARAAGIELGYSANLRRILGSGRHGPSFGDWVAVLQEVRDSRALRSLPDAEPLNELRPLLESANSREAVRLLMGWRNDQAHLRPVDQRDLPMTLEAAHRHLVALMKSMSVLADMPLIHVTSFRWDTLTGHGAVRYREFMGDHPVVPTRLLNYAGNNIEEESLYVVDSQRRFHLLRPFLIGRACPSCGNWSVFHVDRVAAETATLKSLEHGHTTEDETLVEPLRQVGML